MEKFCLAGIVKDEADYIIEWIAWHQLAGFNNIILADNSSTDGTRSLLEALETIGVVRVIYQPSVAGNTQVHAYNKALEIALGRYEYVMFLDADEFLVHESQRHGEERRLLEELVASGDVGSISVNWRCFGSGGHESKSPEPVLKRFTHCSDSPDFAADRHVKSMIKVNHVQQAGIHTSLLISDLRYIDCAGEDVLDFSDRPDIGGKPDPRSGKTDSIRQGPLRVHHYVVKSKEEYLLKCQRGTATRAGTPSRGDKYFNYHDVNGAKFLFEPGKLSRLEREMSAFKQRLNNETPFGRSLTGTVGVSNAKSVIGWITDDTGYAKDLFVNIFVNGAHVARVSADMFRPDLLQSGKSADGYCGFRWTHPCLLGCGDRVTVEPHANMSKLAGCSDVVIGDD
ncbi:MULTISPECIES: glycosyltransferase family 2 protein [Halomonas]|uniref:glycosyltransferase family 2 protein n=1 Tax=Halomonas TaxID=2745 RepID=UPI001A90134A|nr:MULTISPECIES: glycosyltransferase family 2 protein [Halomonas]MBN8413729.1 glycosyltransferase family 2 protein [Halomonas litopenaei]MBY5967823.1 glycosyltransferase family 2 protein [Halomonas denitrificans]MBY5983325.1 glycosyltransferase family 2 protein [Halomonas sp. DP5Y7-2]